MENEVEENKLEVKIEKRTQNDVWRKKKFSKNNV
jgi:hypothetical protein